MPDHGDEVPTINEALLELDGETAFVEVEASRQPFERREIETGRSDGVAIEIVSGLSGDGRIQVVR